MWLDVDSCTVYTYLFRVFGIKSVWHTSLGRCLFDRDYSHDGLPNRFIIGNSFEVIMSSCVAVLNETKEISFPLQFDFS